METSVFARLGRFSVRRRWLVIAAWLILLVAMGMFAPGLQNRLSSGGFEVPGSESLSVQHRLDDRFTQQFAATAIVVVSNPDSTVEAPEFAGFVEQLSDRLGRIPNVEGVVSFYTTGAPTFVSANRRTTYLIVGLEGSQNDWLETSAEVIGSAGEGAPAGFEVVTGGQAPFFNRLSEVSRHDIEKAELYAFPITALVLLLAFGTVVA